MCEGGKGQDFFLWMLLYTLTKKIIEVQGNMLNAFSIILFYKVVWCLIQWPIHWCATKETKVHFPLPTYTMKNMYIRMYTLYMCVNV